MPYRMKNRFLILGLTGPLGSGCSDTAKFLSGRVVNGFSINDILKSQIKLKDELSNKIQKTYNDIENIKISISNRQNKRLGPYKRQFIDPIEDPIIKKHETEARAKHEKLKFYVTRREVINVLENFNNDDSLKYDNLNCSDKELFGYQPFIYISFTLVILKRAIEVFNSDGGSILLKNYFSKKISNDSKYDSSIYQNLHEIIEKYFIIEKNEMSSYFRSINFINDRGYTMYNRTSFGQNHDKLFKHYCQLIRKISINFNEYITKIYDILNNLKKDTQEKREDDYVFAFSEVLQDWGDNCRKTGNPFEIDNEKAQFNPDNLYCLSNDINAIIKFLRFRIRYLDDKYYPIPCDNNSETLSTLFVIECFRNPYEIEFFRSRYAEFYLMSIFAPQHIRCKRIKHFSVNRDERDQGEFRKTSELNKLDVTSCVLLSDINLRNDLNEGNFQKRFFEKVLRYLALIRSPGCIPPNDDELYMHLAYSNSLKSNCISRKVGAIILGPEGYILGAGWNDVGEGQIGCGLRTKNDYLNINSIPQVSSDRDKEKFHNLVRSNRGEYVCYKDLMSKLHINKKLEKQIITDVCLNDCINTIKSDIGIKRLEFCRALHAEENALLQIAKVGGMPISGGTIYTTTYPCELCAKKLYQTGIRTIYYTEPYPESISEQVFLKDGNRSIEMIPFEGVKSHSYFKLFKPIYDKKEMAFIELV